MIYNIHNQRIFCLGPNIYINFTAFTNGSYRGEYKHRTNGARKAEAGRMGPRDI